MIQDDIQKNVGVKKNTIHSSRIFSQHGVSKVTLGSGITKLQLVLQFELPLIIVKSNL